MQKTKTHVGLDAIIHTRAVVGSWIVVFASLVTAFGQSQQESQATLLVRKCNDFSITGKGNDPEWTKAGWNQLTKLDEGGKPNVSKFKILYSATGIYVLFQGDDEKITTKPYKDFESILMVTSSKYSFTQNPTPRFILNTRSIISGRN